MRLKNRVFFYGLTGIVLIFLAALPRRLIFPLNGLFAFNYDQGRDFLAASKIIWEKDFTFEVIGGSQAPPSSFQRWGLCVDNSFPFFPNCAMFRDKDFLPCGQEVSAACAELIHPRFSQACWMEAGH